MRKYFSFLLFTFGLTLSLSAQSGYQIEVDIEGYTEQELYLGFYYGDKTLLKDTATVNADGKYVFQDEEALEGGLYLIVLAPENNYFQILIDKEEQQYKIKTKKDDLTRSLSFTNAPDNKLFYDYLGFLGDFRPQAEALQKEMAAATDEGKKASIQKELDGLNEKVQAYQEKIIQDHPSTLTATIIKANLPVPTAPKYEGSSEEVQKKEWLFHRAHFFDNMDLTDSRLLRTPFFHQKVVSYVEQLHYQTPDSLIVAVDKVLSMVKPAKESFKYWLIHFLNKYAASKIVGMDAVYVHLGLNYYGKGLADWTDEEQMNKIIDNAKKLEPLLIGKTAPNIKMQKQDGSSISLYDVSSPYTILYFWRYDCGHCKESTPFMKEFYEKYKDKGIKIFAVCTKRGDEIQGCWDYINEKEISDWIHTVDPRSLYMLDYNVETTPQMYILDENKEIVMKKISAEQLEEVMNKIIEINEKENDTSGQ